MSKKRKFESIGSKGSLSREMVYSLLSIILHIAFCYLKGGTAKDAKLQFSPKKQQYHICLQQHSKHLIIFQLV